MFLLRALISTTLALPVAAQAWDFRLEIPFPKGQSLPQTTLEGAGQLIRGELNTGKGFIFSANHRIVRFGPILRLDWGLEFTQFRTDGTLSQTSRESESKLAQIGFGAGVNAQFSVPFTGIAGEMGLIQRFQNYRFEGDGAKKETNLSRTWLRVGVRYNLPTPLLATYLCASYQEPLNKERPVKVDRVSDLGAYLNTQGTGQEFQRVWTFGVGVSW